MLKWRYVYITQKNTFSVPENDENFQSMISQKFSAKKKTYFFTD